MENPNPPSSRPRQTFRKLLRGMALALGLGYPLSLLSLILLFRWIGEQWWVVVVLSYLPRIGFAWPLPFVMVATWLWAPRWALALQIVSLGLILFPLMGWELGWSTEVDPRQPTLRILSYNVHGGSLPLNEIPSRIHDLQANVVMLQEAKSEQVEVLARVLPAWYFHGEGQFILASRFPLRKVVVPPPISYPQGTGGARYVKYTLDTPLGLVDVFNVHPTSPREGFEELRGNGLRYEFRSGRLFRGLARRPIEFNAYRRKRQLLGVARSARSSDLPVVIAGDTNLPHNNWLLAHTLSDFQDGFVSVGRGFGYTYPTKRPWLRLDRIFTNSRLKFLDFGVCDRGASDHLCVFATVASAR